MLRLVLPKGSLERATFELFEAADLAISRSSEVDYRASVKDHRISEVRILRPQEIPHYVASGLFDIGITGRDWVEETNAEVASLGQLNYSKATSQPTRIVLAVAEGSPWSSVEDMPAGVRVSTEYPALTERFFADHGVKADVVLSYGATEAKVPEIADAVVELTETGRALKAAGLRVIATLLVSHTELIACPGSYADADRRRAMEHINTLLQGALMARGRVLVKLNVEAADLDKVISLLPAMRSPTVSQLFGGGSYAVEAVVPKESVNKLIPELKDAGASDIIELPITKIVP
jgi:ATP phosphoribosyltransferase